MPLASVVSIRKIGARVKAGYRVASTYIFFKLYYLAITVGLASAIDIFLGGSYGVLFGYYQLRDLISGRDWSNFPWASDSHFLRLSTSYIR